MQRHTTGNLCCRSLCWMKGCWALMMPRNIQHCLYVIDDITCPVWESECTGAGAWFFSLCLLSFPSPPLPFFKGIPYFASGLGTDIPVHDASKAIYLMIVPCLPCVPVSYTWLLRARLPQGQRGGRPQSVLIFWWVPALVQPLLVPLGCLSVLFFLLYSFST